MRKNNWIWFGKWAAVITLLCVSLAAGHEYFLIFMAAVLYLLPSIIGWEKPHAAQVVTLNILLGWTLLGWVIALVWALKKEPEPQAPTSGPKLQSTVSVADELERLKKLRDEGVISMEEYEIAKRKAIS